jgi:hypothetical protein
MANPETLRMILRDLAYFLEAYGAGIVGTDLFESQMPETIAGKAVPTELCTAILGPYSGLPPVRVQPTTVDAVPSIRYQQPRVQIEVRGNKENYLSGEAKIAVVYRTLAMIKNRILSSGVFYQSVEPVQDPFFMRWDENRRPRFVFNVQVFKNADV